MARVIVVVFEGVQTLDVTGPAEVFATAREGGRSRYEIAYAAIGGGQRRTSSRLQMTTRDLARIRPRASDIVVVPGGEQPAIEDALRDEALLGWLRRAARKVQRMTSVCSGAFVLAAAGILDGKRATTHWRACEQLARAFPQRTGRRERDLPQRGTGLDVSRRDHGDRYGARDRRAGSGKRRSRSAGGRAGAVRPPAGLPDAVQRSAGRADPRLGETRRDTELGAHAPDGDSTLRSGQARRALSAHAPPALPGAARRPHPPSCSIASASSRRARCSRPVARR